MERPGNGLHCRVYQHIVSVLAVAVESAAMAVAVVVPPQAPMLG